MDLCIDPAGLWRPGRQLFQRLIAGIDITMPLQNTEPVVGIIIRLGCTDCIEFSCYGGVKVEVGSTEVILKLLDGPSADYPGRYAGTVCDPAQRNKAYRRFRWVTAK